MGADFKGDFLAINYDAFSLKIWFPDLLSVALRKAHVVAELLTFTGDITFLHNRGIFYPYQSNKSTIAAELLY